MFQSKVLVDAPFQETGDNLGEHEGLLNDRSTTKLTLTQFSKAKALTPAAILDLN